MLRTRGTTLAFSAPATGTANLIVSGAGILVLGGNNTYAGSTTISSGSTLQIGAGGATGTLGAGAVTDDGSLIFNTNSTFTLTLPISGSGRFTQAGSGTILMSVANTYKGLTTIASGGVKIGVTNAIPSGANAGDVQLDGSLDLKRFFFGGKRAQWCGGD